MATPNDLRSLADRFSEGWHDGIKIDASDVVLLSNAANEIEQLRKDAERYAALRRGQKWSVVDGIGNTLRAEELDTAIDAAMKGTP